MLHVLDVVGDILAGAAGVTAMADAVTPAFSERSVPTLRNAPSDKKAERDTYPAPSEIPTQKGPCLIRFDFNVGARIMLPSRNEGEWHVYLRDLDTGNILFESRNKGAIVRSSKRFYVRFGIEVWDQPDGGEESLVFAHDYNITDRDVLIQFPTGTLGDILAWFAYVPRFGVMHRCRLTCAMAPHLIELLRPSYPEINFVTPDQVIEWRLADTAYATYCLGLFFDDVDNHFQPTDFRQVGLHRTAAYILGVDPAEEAPSLKLPDESRPIAEPYICIAVQSSTQSKYWNNPEGWQGVIRFAKQRGFRVICIDQRPVHGHGLVWTHIPHGAEDQTGDRPLAERARWLRHAAAFVGLSSGLAWLAWAAGTPVVMISGFTHPTNEFTTPHRVINWHACNSCWNDVRLRFDHKDFLWCPRHAGTSRQFECTKLITVEQVTNILHALLATKDTPLLEEHQT